MTDTRFRATVDEWPTGGYVATDPRTGERVCFLSNTRGGWVTDRTGITVFETAQDAVSAVLYARAEAERLAELAEDL